MNKKYFFFTSPQTHPHYNIRFSQHYNVLYFLQRILHQRTLNVSTGTIIESIFLQELGLKKKEIDGMLTR